MILLKFQRGLRMGLWRKRPEKKCLDCGVDISLRSKNAKYCLKCVEKRVRIRKHVRDLRKKGLI